MYDLGKLQKYTIDELAKQLLCVGQETKQCSTCFAYVHKRCNGVHDAIKYKKINPDMTFCQNWVSETNPF